MHRFRRLALAVLALGTVGAAQAAWQPTRPVEFYVAAGNGGGSDQFARIVQSVIQKYKLLPVPVIVTNRGGGNGTEALVAAKAAAGDATKLVFATNMVYLMPLISKVGYAVTDVRPVAVMTADEFILWVSAKSPYKTAADLIADAKARNGNFKMGGAQSKDTDHTLTMQIQNVTGAKMTYVPFKSGAEVAVQLAGEHVEANTNNPGESAAHWKAGTMRPLCVFSKQRLTITDKVTATQSFADVPTCRESGIAIDEYRMPRTVWLPVGTSDEQVKYYTDVMAKVREKPEWKAWLRTTSQSDVFLTGSALTTYVKSDEARAREQFKLNGWLVSP